MRIKIFMLLTLLLLPQCRSLSQNRKLAPVPPSAYSQDPELIHASTPPSVSAQSNAAGSSERILPPPLPGASAAAAPSASAPSARSHTSSEDPERIPPPPIPDAGKKSGRAAPLRPIDQVPGVPLYSASAERNRTVEKEVFTTGQCPHKLPSPSQRGETYCNIFPEGCLYVPLKVAKRPLVYFRDQPLRSAAAVPESTQALFSSQARYQLHEVAEANEQVIFATHSPQTVLSEKTLACLKKFSSDNKVDVASHREGYLGLGTSAPLLKGSVSNLRLLDTAMNGDPLISAITGIGAPSCSGYYTSYDLSPNVTSKSMALYVAQHSGCGLEELTGHIVSVSPFLRKSSRLVQRSNSPQHTGAI